MQYAHTMVRVSNLDESLDFFCNKLGLVEIRRVDNEKGKYTNVFVASPQDVANANGRVVPSVELTFNWGDHKYDAGRNFGHLAFYVDDIYVTCRSLMDAGVVMNRPPRDGHLAFIKTPDNVSIELIQRGEDKPIQEPWVSMPNVGSW